MNSQHQEKAAAGIREFFQSAHKVIGDSWEEVMVESSRRVSAPIAVRMLDQIGLNAQTSSPFKLIDNGCGVGVVASELHALVKPEVLRQSTVLCGDFADQMVGLVQKRISQGGWVNTSAQRIDAQVSMASDQELGSR